VKPTFHPDGGSMAKNHPARLRGLSFFSSHHALLIFNAWKALIS
jgi:hypothetical protein